MIIKSSQRAGHSNLAAHLLKTRDEDGEEQMVTITSSNELISTRSVKMALYEMQERATVAAKVKKDLYHVSMNPLQELSADQWERAWEIYEQEYGLEGYAFIEVTHDKKGRLHKHRAYSRVDMQTEKAIKLSFTKIRNELVARQLEHAFGHGLTIGKHNKTVMSMLREQGRDEVVQWMNQHQAHMVARPIAKEQFGEIQQDRRSRKSGQRRRGSEGAMTKAAVKELLEDAYAKTNNGTEFAATIAEHGLTLVREYRDRRGRSKLETFVVIDAGGERHSPRRMLGVKVAELRNQWRDYEGATPAIIAQPLDKTVPSDATGQTAELDDVPRYIDYGAVDPADQEVRATPPPAVPSVPSKQQLRIVLMEAYAATDTGKAFEAAMAEHNLLLCRSERRQALFVVDVEGNAHNTARLIGVKTAEIQYRWADLDPKTLLTTVEAKQLREMQWARLMEQQEAEAVEQLRQEMTTADRLLEHQLLEDIAQRQMALGQELYDDLAGEELGAKLLLGTSPYSLANSNTNVDNNADTAEVDGSTAAAWEGLGMNPETMVLLYGDEEDGSNDVFDDGSTYGYEDLTAWQEQTQDNTVRPPSLAPAKQDGRSLVTQQSHWQTIADAEPASERTRPQEKASGGVARREPTAEMTSIDSASSLPSNQQYGNDADPYSWGLAETIVSMLQTYVGNLAEGERDARIEAALGVARSTTQNELRSHHADSPSNERPQQQSSAAKTYLRALGKQLQQQGRNAYNQADRWLAERLARRGFSRRETRRVLARYSPQLMEQGPSRRVGYIRHITDRVYRRQEYWRPPLTSSANAIKTKGAYDQATQRYVKNAGTAQSHQREAPQRRTSSAKPVCKPKWRQQSHQRDERDT